MSLPHRISGNLALDLANTISWRNTSREVDHLATFDNVVAWSKDVGLIGDDFVLSPSEQKTLYEQVLALRTAIRGAGSAIANDLDPSRPDSDVIRDIAALALCQASLSGTPYTLHFEGIYRVTGAIAWSALDLLRGEELSRLKQCPPDDCHWLFIDRTKNASRRWCDMGTCGNRAKKKAHRAAL
ncbi:putative RNA-binding Zn ribbon-like protein [Pseudorhizobium tarimense]|uniref:RNA-binding Zn ribbon-like protein n=1 Tax=Pseudorhizobium tarimense TaxID=1079109 RepID=A0ABV2HE63_9HYPH|nr:CGNR zinc finger domain-containing protein [Pseudorhizobium tarimense]MCJ8521795.1 CGNR zinc finger domain-containing protein [Pseudorhizobium tarimense]